MFDEEDIDEETAYEYAEEWYKIADTDGDEASLVDYRAWYLETQEVTRPRMDDGEVEQELRLCKALLSWDPFCHPARS